MTNSTESKSLPEVVEPQTEKPGKLKECDIVFEVGCRVTHADLYHVRANQEGIVEGINELTGDLVVFWLSDGDNQRHKAHRSYRASDLAILGH